MAQRSDHDDESTTDADDSQFDSLLRKVANTGEDDLALPLLPGAVLSGKYRIGELIGRGAMGAVYSATHVLTEKPVAVKWMLRSSNEQMHKRFIREALVAGRIDHPNVVNVYDVGQEGRCVYLVMELLRGESLRERLVQGRLQLTELLTLLVPAMRGISAMHRAGVIHRDLKPDNIFLCKDSQGVPREAKVLDFGVSTLEGSLAADATLTQAGAMIGTPAYMSPEQLHDPRDVDARSDVYSFGVILYECLAGHLPFRGESYPALIVSILNAKPIDLAVLRPDLPATLTKAVMRALAKEPADRYSDVDALTSALTGAEPERPRSTRLWKVARWPLAAALTVLTTLAVWTQRKDSVSQPPLAANVLAPATFPAASLYFSGDACTQCLADGCKDENAACLADSGCSAWFERERTRKLPVNAALDSWRALSDARWARDHGEKNWTGASMPLSRCALTRCAEACGMGRNLACVGQFEWPASYPKTIELRFKIGETARDVGVPGLRLRACAPGTACEQPLGETATDAGGEAKLMVDLTRLTARTQTLLPEFTGYVRIDGLPEYKQVELLNSSPYLDHDYERTWAESRAESRARWAESGLPALGPTRAALSVNPRDCSAWPITGATLHVSKVSDSTSNTCTDCLIVYKDADDEFDSKLKEFVPNGGAAAVAILPPGQYRVEIRDTKTHALISVVRRVTVRPDYDPSLVMYPASKSQLAELK